MLPFVEKKFANRDEVAAYVEASLREALPSCWIRRGSQDAELLAWNVSTEGEPEWSTGYTVFALPSGDMFFVLHDNRRVGILSMSHMASRATIFHRSSLGFPFEGEPFTLARGFASLFATAQPNLDSPT